MGADTVSAPPDGSGLDRRSLIKRAAAVGAAAWTAPVIIGSLASPASALTVSGCFLVQWTISSCAFTGFTNAQDCVPIDECTSPTSVDIAPDGFCSTAITIVCVAATSLTLTIPAGCSCVFVSGRAKTTAGGVAGCIDGVLGGGGKTLTFTTPNAVSRVSFYINC